MDNIFKTKKQNSPLRGEITIPPDKSISHRSLIFGALVNSKIKIKNLSLGEDCISTLKIFEKLGVKYEFISKRDLISDSSKGLDAKGNILLDCGNSGTTTRLLSGLLASLNFTSTLVGDKSLSKRPMKRIIEPLGLMGAKIQSKDNKLPLVIEGTKLKSITYHTPVASAQVKSCILLAGLNSEGETVVYEDILSRNHSEILLEYLGADIQSGKDEKGYYTKIKKSSLEPRDIEIVGDISSAAFFMVAAAITPGSSITIKNVGINPTRSGILDVFSQAGVDFELLDKRLVTNEPCADIKVNYTENIKPFTISGRLIPELIDEIPVLAVLAAASDGSCVVSDASDLRNKESDRIKTIVEAFSSLGIDIVEKKDGFIINGGKKISAEALLETYLDHRLAMTYFVLSLINEGQMQIKGFNCTNTSFPEFLELFCELGYER